MQKKGGLSWSFIKQHQTVMIILCALFSLGKKPSLNISTLLVIEVVVHYLVLAEKLLVISFIVLESLKFICFFLMCQYYCKAAL
jgi:hypothetical protein